MLSSLRRILANLDKEFVFYTSITIIWWGLSVSLLLPLVIFLKLCRTFRDVWFAFLFIRIGGLLRGPGLEKVRKRAFDLLKKHLGDRKKNAPLEILEIGVGSGATLQFYPENSNLTALEPNESMIKYFEENRRKYPRINYKRTVIAMAEDMREIEDGSFDVVVGIYVLCSVKSVRSALKEVKRVLKPGGKYLFAEHIMYPGFTREASLQNLTNPVWSTYYNGCNLNRDHDEEIRRAGFSDVVAEKFCPKDVWLYIRHQTIGIATK